jgi:hypothetical protein
MSSIIWNGATFHGIIVFGRGVFTNDKHDQTYAGQIRDGYACGLGVLTWSSGSKAYAEHGPDGKYDGRCLGRFSHGDTGYRLYERGEAKDSATVSADGRCKYNGKGCAPDDPRLLALIAQVLPVEVHPATQPPTRDRSPLAPKQSSDGSAGSFGPRRRSPTPRPPRCTPTPHAVAGDCAAQPNRSRTARHDHAVTRARTVCCSGRTGGILLHPNNRRIVHTTGPSRQLRSHAIVQHAAVLNAATRDRLYVSVHLLPSHVPVPHVPVPRACRPARPFARFSMRT